MKESHTSRKHSVAWRAPEYIFKKKTLIWYTHVTVFFLFALVALLLLKVTFGAIITALLFWVFIAKANEHPKTVNYEVSKNGVSIDDRHINYSEIRSFSVDETATLSVITLTMQESFSLPVYLVMRKNTLDGVVEHLIENIPLDNRFSFSRWLAHWLHY